MNKLNYLEYDLPMMTNSTKEISVKEWDGSEVLTMQKFFKNKAQIILGTLMPGFVTNITVRKNSKIVAQSNEIFTLGRPKWNIEYKDEKGTKVIRLQDTRLVKTRPRATFHIDSDEFKIERDFGERTTKLYRNGELVGQLQYDKIIPPRKNTVRFFTERLNVPLLLCILHTHEMSS